MLQGFGFWQWEALCSVRAGAEDALGEVMRGSCRAGRLGRVPEQTSCVRAVCVQCCRQSCWAPPALLCTVNVLLAHVSARSSPVGIGLVRCWLGGWVAVCPR